MISLPEACVSLIGVCEHTLNQDVRCILTAVPSQHNWEAATFCRQYTGGRDTRAPQMSRELGQGQTWFLESLTSLKTYLFIWLCWVLVEACGI